MTAPEIAHLELDLSIVLAAVLRIEQKLLRIEGKVIVIEANLTPPAAAS